MKKRMLLLALAVFALGCGEGRYQIVTIGENPIAYRIDTKTGEMLLIVHAKAAPVNLVATAADLYK